MGKIVGIDCFKLVKGRGKSIGIYIVAEKIVKNIGKEHSDCTWIVFGNKENKHFFDNPQVNFVLVPFNCKNKLICILWELFIVKFYMVRYHIDLMLFPRGFAPAGSKRNCIVIVHDMIPFYYHKNFPKAINRWENKYIMRRLRTSIKKSKAVITISDCSRKEIEKIVPECKDKVIVIENGYDWIETEGLAEREIKEDYLLAVTSSLPHKNARGILLAYKNYYKSVDHALKLVIVGICNVDCYVTIEQEIKENIICKTYLKDNEYYSLYKYAKCFLFLSLKEGFGFPPLEAMQFGVPGIVSNKSSIPEVAGNAAVLVDPMNENEIGKTIAKVLADEQLQVDLQKEGKKNLERFQWGKQIKQYITLIDRL